MATQVALAAKELRFFRSILGEIKSLIEARATYAQRLAQVDAELASLQAEADAELATMGLDPKANVVEVNETAKVLVVTPKG